MARQSRYEQDPTLSGADRLTGINATDGQTVNYTVDSIAEYFAQTGGADGSRLGYRYSYEGEFNANIAVPDGGIQVTFVTGTPAANQNFSTIRFILSLIHI